MHGRQESPLGRRGVPDKLLAKQRGVPEGTSSTAKRLVSKAGGGQSDDLAGNHLDNLRDLVRG
jgi:hypothetical protein